MYISYKDYWDEIRDIAQDVTDQANKYESDIYEILHETLDGHQWVIYTAYNYDVIRHSPNDEAWREYFGDVVPQNLDAARACMAMTEDVQQHADFCAESEDI